MPPADSNSPALTRTVDPALGMTHTLREAARHGARAVLLCSFQKEESVLVDELLRLDQGTGAAVRIVTIDTGALFEQTLSTWRAFEERFGVEIEVSDASSTGAPWSGPEHCCSAAKAAGRAPTRRSAACTKSLPGSTKLRSACLRRCSWPTAARSRCA